MDEMMMASAARSDHHRDSLSRLMASLPMPMAVAPPPPPHQHQHQHQHQSQQMEVPGTSAPPVVPPKREGGTGPIQIAVPGERVPQWTPQETRDFISIRADLERDFTVAKRNKTLWEAVAARMRDRGYRRSPEQCKCKWKNLVNRYKGKETSDPEIGRQCPFFEELHAVFTERAKSMQRLLLESEPGSGGQRAKKKLKRLSGDKSSDDFSEEDDEEGDDSEEDRPGKTKKRKQEKERQTPRGGDNNKQISRATTVQGIIDILQEFFQQQQRIERQWQDMLERRAQERRVFEQEWRQSMEKLERERLMLEKEWRQREEQRRIREEGRAEKRDALLTTLLNRLLQEDF